MGHVNKGDNKKCVIRVKRREAGWCEIKELKLES